jgi:hypothetical protein
MNSFLWTDRNDNFLGSKDGSEPLREFEFDVFQAEISQSSQRFIRTLSAFSPAVHAMLSKVDVPPRAQPALGF